MVESSIGHIRDLPTSASEIPARMKDKPWARLGVNVDEDFEPIYVVDARKKKVVADLKAKLRSADELLLATDEDREGEAIAWHLVQELKPKVPVRRMVFHEIMRPAIERALSRSDVPLREKTLWRMLYETAARASEVLALNIEDLDLDARRAPIRSKGGDTEWICWGSGTAHLLPRLIRGRQAGPVFLSERRPGPASRPAANDLCPVTGRARLGYDRARILFTRYTGWELHQLRHSAATHLGEQGIPLQLIMAKTRHRNPRTAMRYVRQGAEAVAEITALLEPPRRLG